MLVVLFLVQITSLMSTSGVSIIKAPDKVLPLVQIYIEHVSQGNIEHLSFYRKKKDVIVCTLSPTLNFLNTSPNAEKRLMSQSGIEPSFHTESLGDSEVSYSTGQALASMPEI